MGCSGRSILTRAHRGWGRGWRSGPVSRTVRPVQRTAASPQGVRFPGMPAVGPLAGAVQNGFYPARLSSRRHGPEHPAAVQFDHSQRGFKETLRVITRPCPARPRPVDARWLASQRSSIHDVRNPRAFARAAARARRKRLHHAHADPGRSDPARPRRPRRARRRPDRHRQDRRVRPAAAAAPGQGSPPPHRLRASRAR